MSALTLPTPLMRTLLEAGMAAQAQVLARYGKAVKTTLKADDSPVTEADLAADRAITQVLATAFPGLPILSEETVDKADPAAFGARYFLVDPLDGTREFLNRTDEFTVNIALIENGRPIAGLVAAPALGEVFVSEQGVGCFAQARPEAPFEKIKAPSAPKPRAVQRVTVSRSHLDPVTALFVERLAQASIAGAPEEGAPGKQEPGQVSLIRAGSSLKFCRLAQGQADLYPRFGPTCEWDTGAGQAIAEAAGVTVLTLEGFPLGYGKWNDLLRNPPFLAGHGRLAGERALLAACGESAGSSE